MEPIKQEIINNIFENGDKLITGPILQTVLIDMIDDVNVKDQEILSKTGSWDDAATQIPNLATKAEVTNLSESVARDLENVVDVDLTGYATEQWVQNQGYLKEHQDISNLATKTELTQAENNLQGNITSLSESVARDIANVDVDLTGYATETWVESQGYLKEHQDISNLATKDELNSVSQSVQTDISNLATKTELTSVSESVQTDITNLSESVANSAVWKKGTKKDSIVQVIADGTDQPTASEERAIATGKNTTASGQGSHAEGFGANAPGFYSHAEGSYTDAVGAYSHAEGSFTEAKGSNSHAEGSNTTAKGSNSHAEGHWTNASGDYSHVEGESTIASGSYSHAEGNRTIASNEYEHAQGMYNCTSSNQIFSVGAGERIGSNNETRRNAVSILAVPNSETQVNTASVFVQNVGGYDGTNPEPGTNDLATVIDRVSSIWKKGTGTDSIVQAIAKGTNPPTATGNRAIAEGQSTYASGECSHAEGYLTTAEGWNSHAEGWGTKASNTCEHAQGRHNHNSKNQIFSIGTGNNPNDRRNAVSVLEVSNNNSYTSSFFVQNIGGYDGTNPLPGTNDLATVINNLPSGGGSSETLWKKGTGEDSLVQKLTGNNEANTPTATGVGAIALGFATTASGNNSHAEGQTTVASGLASHAEGNNTIASAHCSHAEGGDTKASGSYSHAEGIYTEALGQASHTEGFRTTASKEGSHAEGESTIASGSYSHAEGGYTLTSNQYEHAQGQYNHNSTNQIFSVGAGEKIGETVTRRNAVSILEVPNAETQVVTASVFVQNVGGYDGTNPEPGTNDLATVVGKVSSIWKKGTGQDSVVQVLSGGMEAYTSIATENGAIAIGTATTASGRSSHAEGWYTNASGDYSHAEGRETKASKGWSHAEGGWTNASGNYSHAEGYVTKASGEFSHAEGDSTKATGQSSHAEGKSTIASGSWSHVEGESTLASGSYSHAEGQFAKALGLASHAEGHNTKAEGSNSHVEGESTKASGICSHAEGYFTTSSGDYSHAEGNSTLTSNEYEHAQGRYNHNSTNQIFSIGTGNSDTDRRNAVSVLEVSNNNSYTGSVFVQNIGGYDGTNPIPGTNDLATVINGMSTGGGSSETLWEKGEGQDSIVQKLSGGSEARKPKATGTGSIAIGLQTIASGDYSLAEGYYSEASGFCSHAEGYDAKASGSHSHAEGYTTKARGDYSHAEGSWTEASGQSSHAEGGDTKASGRRSHAEGYYTIASNTCEHAQGRYNHSSTNQIFSIGTGNSDTDRRNAVSVLEVSNNNSYTSSVFIQNIGGYDGTNPTPGTNDLATVLNNTETWTFTLEDGSTVTKNMRIA